MGTITCFSIEKPENEFRCRVIRPQSAMRYQDPSDGKWKPLHGERVEEWKVLAKTLEGAKRVAEYHFYNSNILAVEAL